MAFGLLTHMGLSWQMVSLLLEPRWADTGRAARGLGEQGTLPGDQQATSGGMEAVGRSCRQETSARIPSVQQAGSAGRYPETGALTSS